MAATIQPAVQGPKGDTGDAAPSAALLPQHGFGSPIAKGIIPIPGVDHFLITGVTGQQLSILNVVTNIGSADGGTYTITVGSNTFDPFIWSSSDNVINNALGNASPSLSPQVSFSGSTLAGTSIYIFSNVISDIDALAYVTFDASGLTGPDAPYTITTTTNQSASPGTPIDPLTAVAPTYLDEFGYCVDGRYFYIVGGFYSGGNGTQWWSGDIYRFDMVAETWTLLATMPGHFGAEGIGCTILNGKIYAVVCDSGMHIGSPNGPYLYFAEKVFYSYDLIGNTWTREIDPPFSASYQMGCTHNGKMYVLSPFSLPNWDNIAWLYVFDPVMNTWTHLTDGPELLYDAGAFWSDGTKLWFAGRADNNSNGVSVVWSYDPGTDIWTDELAVGGFTGWNGRYQGAVVKLSSTKVWIVGGRLPSVQAVGAVEIDTVARTAVAIPIDLSVLENAQPPSYFGGGAYNGKVYVAGDGNSPSKAAYINPPGPYGLRNRDLLDTVDVIAEPVIDPTFASNNWVTVDLGADTVWYLMLQNNFLLENFHYSPAVVGTATTITVVLRGNDFNLQCDGNNFIWSDSGSNIIIVPSGKVQLLVFVWVGTLHKWLLCPGPVFTA